MKNGTIKAWGNNLDGQLGILRKTGDPYRVYIPTIVPGVTNVKNIVGSTITICALLDNGTVMSWGTNSTGGLGRIVTDKDAANLPAQIPNLTDVSSIYMSGHSILALLNDGTIKSWGRNDMGQLGISTNSGTSTPIQFPTLITNINNIKNMKIKNETIFALTNDGIIKAWGNNICGQLGFTPNSNANPTPKTLSLTSVKNISCGDDFQIAIMNDNTVKAWGSNGCGQLGVNALNGMNLNPVTVTNLSGIKDVIANGSVAYAVMNDGTIKAWGSNRYGNLGISTNNTTFNPNPTPTIIPSLKIN